MQLNKRIKQLLGLPPKSNYKYITEFWLDSKLLIRPTLNPSIEYSGRQALPTKINLNNPQFNYSNINRNYPSWFNVKLDQQLKNRDKSYAFELLMNGNSEDDPYPWTGLGYTFDWGANSDPIAHAGLSEFLILDSKNLTTKNLVSPVVSTDTYCQD